MRQMIALSVLSLAPAMASAAPVASFVVSPTQPTAAAVAADQSLANTTAYELRVTTPADWTNATIAFDLTAGSFYNTAGVGANTPPNSAFFAIFPQLQFDTYLSAPNETTPGFAGTVTFAPNAINAAWFDTERIASGTYTIGRFTVSNNATGLLSGLLFDNQSGGVGTPFSFAVPEPASLALAGMAAVAGLRRRH